MTKPISDFGASARARLLDLTKKRGGEFQFTLQRYAAERFLYRLGISDLRDRFVLKGAMLFVHWDPSVIRPTKDVDLAGYWENDPESLQTAFASICSVAYPRDGLTFDLKTLTIEPIRDGAEYHGYRLRIRVLLSGAVIPFQVDVGFGDAVVPEPAEIVYPVLLDADPPRIRAYPVEASIAEKCHAMVTLGEANSRYKDFYDVYILSSRFEYSGEVLARSLRATFSRRRSVSLSTSFPALMPAFYSDSARAEQWRRYLQRSRLTDAPQDFGEVGERIISFLEPPIAAVAGGLRFEPRWPPGGPWR